jgi:putative transposase
MPPAAARALPLVGNVWPGLVCRSPEIESKQDHRGAKGRYGPMRGFKCPRSAGEFCRAYDELRNFLRSGPRAHQKVSAEYRRFHFLRRTATVLSSSQAA